MSVGKRLVAALGISWALALCFGSLAAQAQVGTRAGVAAAVRGPVQQISYRTPQGVGRNVTGGDQINLGDRIVTGPGGGLQIMLLDGTTFSVGPNTSLVIDEFVYNPATGAGRLTANVARGTLRVISGRLSRYGQDQIRIKLPMATVGIRGTIVILSGDDTGFSINLFGIGANNSADRPQSNVIVNGTIIFRANYGCFVTAAKPACNPQPVDSSLIQTLIRQIGGNARNISPEEFKLRTGMDLVEALQLLQTQGGFEQLALILSGLYQDQNRPGNAPPPRPPCSYPSYCP